MRRIQKMRRLLGIGTLISAVACSAVWAQSTAQVSGTVKDQSGAVLPGVEVMLTQTDTGLKRSVITNEAGSYTMPNLPVGPYKLEASLPGFATFAQTGIVLTVGANPVINVSLSVGQVSETVEVQADAALVETRNSGVGQVIDNVRVLELPLNGRQVSDLILLSGASVDGGAQPTNRNYPTASISISGGLNNGVTYLLDGGTYNDPFNNLSLPMPFPDALQEFKVETSAVSAQYGQHSAGAVSAVTKSGTNEFHGDLFEFVRNGSLNARNAFAVRRDSLKRNQFGGVIGGPVMKNKLFFFGGIQATTQRSEPTDNIAFIPTAAMLAGDWTAITSPQCNGGRQIGLRAPFADNRIDPSLFSTPSLNLLKRMPTTNDQCGTIHFGRKSNNDEQIVVGRLDYTRSDKHSLFGRYQIARLITPTDYDGTNLLSASQADYNRQVKSFVLGDTYLIGAGTVSSFRGTILRTTNPKTSRDYFSLSDLGVKNVYSQPNYPKLPIISVAGGFSIYSATGTPGFTNSTALQAAEDLSLSRGSHQIGFGVNFIHTEMNLQATTRVPGNVAFAATNTGMGLGDFMLGRMSTFDQSNITSYYFRQNFVAAYLQDTWKATSRWTLNGGVRWEPSLPPWEKHAHVLHILESAFSQGTRSTIFKNGPAGLLYPGDPGVPNNGSFTASELWKFSPRAGFAWDPKGDGRMTIRAAYGLFFDYPGLFQYDNIKDSPPWAARVTLTNPVGGFADPWQGYAGGNPFPLVLSPDVIFPTSGTYVNIPLHLKMPYIHQWNLSLQRQIGADWLIAGNYLGSSVIHQMVTVEGNPAIYLPGPSCVINGTPYSPCSATSNTSQRRKLYLQNPAEGRYYGNIFQVDDNGTRSNNALLLSVQRRRSNGVTVQANYTWSHCIDDGTVATFNTSRGTAERRRLDRGNCELDRRHNFNMSTVYEMPQFSSTTARALATGWQISGIVRVLSGPYLTVLSGIDNAFTATNDERPNLVLLNPYAPNKTNDVWLNPAAFAQPALGTYGNFGSHNILGPGSIRFDVGLTRRFQIRENQSVEFRAEAFNVANHVNPGNPILTLSNASFGKIQSAADPRIMQLALKLVF